MKKLFFSVLFIIFFPILAAAQDCTKGQTVTFAQLPVTAIAGTACTVTDSPNCTPNSIIVAGGGSTTCLLSWNGTNWMVPNTIGGSTVGPTTPLQIQSLGVHSAAPAVAGNADFLDTTSSSSTHLCVNNIATNFPGIGVGASCPVAATAYALAGNTTTTIVNVPGGGTLALRVSNANVETVSSTAINAVAGAALQSSGGTLPTITCSGGSTGTSVTAGSTNNRGSFVSSSTASTNCTLTFSASGVWAQIPHCQFYDASGSSTPVTYSSGVCTTSSCLTGFVSATSATIGYLCM